MKRLVKAALLLLVCVYTAAGAAEKTDGKLFGVRLGAQISNLITDAHWGPYPDISGPGGMLSFDVAFPVSEHFYIHPAIGLDNRNYFTYGEIGIPCVALEGEEPCGGYWEGSVVDILLHMNEDYILPEKYRNDRCYEDKRIGAGVAAGVGHVFDFGLSIDARVSFQFTDLVEGDKECLTSTRVESEMWEENGEIHTRVVSSSSEYMGGSYYKLLKLQLGIGYWF